MTWTTDSSFTKWDFVCVDQNQMPVAKFTANIWAVKKVGCMEFLGPKANEPLVRDELVVTGLVLFYEMVVRINSVVHLFGAAFTKPGQQNARLERQQGQQGQQGE